MTHNYDGVTAASYMDDQSVRSYLDQLFRDHHPEVTDETMIKAIVDRQFHQYPLILMLTECEKRLDAANKEIEIARYRNTGLDKKTDREVKTLTADLKTEKAAHAETKEDLERVTKQRNGFENQYNAMTKAQKTGGR